MKDKLWGVREVAEFLSASESTARTAIAQPDFPERIILWTGAHPRWKASEVMQWAEQRRAA